MEHMKKILISVDLEGIGGIVSPKQCGVSGGEFYQEARRLMAAEINAIIEGVNHGGATAVISDAHSSMLNMPIDLLRGDYLYCCGEDKALSMMGGIDDSFDGVILAGYHARFGTPNAILDHTYSPTTLREVRLNDVPVGEAEINAAVAGYFQVPVLLVSGDSATANQLKPVFSKSEFVVTKESIARYSAICRPPEKIKQDLYEYARRAVENIEQYGSFYRFEGDITMTFDWNTAAMAEIQTFVPGVVRLGDRTTAYTCADYQTLFKLFTVFRRLASSVADPSYL